MAVRAWVRTRRPAGVGLEDFMAMCRVLQLRYRVQRPRVQRAALCHQRCPTCGRTLERGLRWPRLNALVAALTMANATWTMYFSQARAALAR